MDVSTIINAIPKEELAKILISSLFNNKENHDLIKTALSEAMVGLIKDAQSEYSKMFKLHVDGRFLSYLDNFVRGYSFKELPAIGEFISNSLCDNKDVALESVLAGLKEASRYNSNSETINVDFIKDLVSDCVNKKVVDILATMKGSNNG